MKTTERKVEWAAKWIWSPGATRKPFHVSYFRKDFEMKAACRGARVRCAADSKYRLWVNGEYVGFGPARGHPERPYYDTHAVRLKAGRNTVAFLVQHNTDRYPIFASVEGGLICQVEAGGETVAATNGSWRGLSAGAYAALPGRIMPESYDARREPDGWQAPGFDARRWPAARVLLKSKLAPPRNLLPRPIPLIREKRLVPARLLDIWRTRGIDAGAYIKGEDIADSLWQVQKERPKSGLPFEGAESLRAWSGRPLRLDLGAREAVCLVLDFGKETLASPEIAAQGPAGVIVDLGYSECLDDDHVATLWQGLRQSERIVLRAGRTRHRIIQPRGFRFMILRAANAGRRGCRVILEDVSAHEAIYPATPKGDFECSDPLLGRIFDLAARTVNLCMEDAYTDCPWRERLQWVGDAQPETLFSYFCFGAYDLARKAVIEFTSGNTEDGWIPGVFPTSEPFNLPTWGMRVPVIAWEYYLYSGDRSALAAMYRGVRGQMAWLARYENKHGLLVKLPRWCFVDWTKLDMDRNDGAVQGWHLEALESSAKLARAAGDNRGAAAFRRRAARLRKSLARFYWSNARRAFLKYRRDSDLRPPGIPRDTIGQHENFLFSLLKVGNETQRRQALDAVAGATGRHLPNFGDYQSSYRPDGQHGTAGADELIRIATPFWSYYALLALLEANRVAEAVDYMRLCWGLMLEHGATSCWEMWDRHTSLCHGWSAAPAMILPAYVLGVKPVRPGFEQFEVRPRPGGLAWARGRVPTPRGIIEIDWKIRAREFVVRLTVPSGASARVCPPVDERAGWRLTKVDGKPARSAAKAVLREGAHDVVFARPA